MQKNSIGLIVASVIISVALVVSVYILKDAYLNKNISPSIPYINADLSKIENALASKDAMTLDSLAAYLGIPSEKVENFKVMVLTGKIQGLPYVKINGDVIFSKKAFDQWLYDSSRQSYETSLN